MSRNLLIAILLSILPIFELRGGIPFALGTKCPVLLTFAACTGANIVIIPLVFLFLDTVNKHLLKIAVYKKLFDALVDRARKKAHAGIEKYGYVGLALFVAVPLPLTGAYSGCLAAWFFDMERKRATLAIAVGVLIAGIAVTLVVVSGIEALQHIFTKQVQV
ncbi:MAG TPA: small multi-drug export protein [Candidatus Brocadiia bacterium]|nr:small multi-drug export protein [Candidatus Brocadiia bacterium]